jgi:two-component system response regulator HupR/HoxA
MAPTLPTILIVDDEPLNRDLLRRLLYREYKVLEAPDAEAALTVLLATPVDVVLCDQVMPGQSGTELAREVHARFPRTVALLLTGYEDAPEIARACREGVVFEVIGKPWVTSDLKETLRRAVASRV